MKIYLAGKIPKGDHERKNFVDWRERYRKAMQKFFDAEFIDPLARNLDETDPMAVVGKDCRDIKESDFIVVCAEGEMSVGGAQEMVIAKYLKKPVVTVLPKDTTHRRSNITFSGKFVSDWIHPFIFAFSDFIIEDIGEIEKIKDKILTSKIKDISVINEAIRHVGQK
jgi:hypothetical protein